MLTIEPRTMVDKILYEHFSPILYVSLIVAIP